MMVTKNRVKWTMLWIYLINFVLVLALAGNASAAEKKWDAGGATNKWSEPNNWDPNGVPGNGDETWIDIVDANCLIDACAVCFSLEDSNSVGPCYLKMTGGSLTMNGGNLVVGDDPNADGFLIIDGGTLKTGAAALWIGVGQNPPDPAGNGTKGTLILNNGDVNVGSKLILGKNESATGQAYMYDGTVSVGDDIEMGNYGIGDFNMSGGDVNIVDNLKLAIGGAAGATGTATIYIHDGNMHCDEIVMGSSTYAAGTSTIYLYGGLLESRDLINLLDDGAKIDIYEGELRVATATEVNKVRGYVSDGKIVGYDDGGIVDVTAAGGGIGYIRVTARLGDPNLAWGPSPRNYATVAWTPAGPNLGWITAKNGYADTHDVYFGASFSEVNEANTLDIPPFETNRDVNNYPLNRVLDLGRTYYWRIDEVNNNEGAPPGSPWKGDVWQFTMAGYEEVESFNEYADSNALKAVWKLTGSTIDVNSTTRRSRSGKSMKYSYTQGSATDAEANTSTTPTDANKLPVDINDWTKIDIKALTLYFYGDPCNTGDVNMYVDLHSCDGNLAVVYYGDDPDNDVNDLKEPEWHEWNIELSDFDSPNTVNLSNIAKVSIGFNKPHNDGNMYFDDIRLYPRRCVASRLPAEFGDISGPSGVGKDCTVDFYDVNAMRGDWLDTDADRKGSDGVLKGGASWVDDDDRGGCIQLDGLDGWVDLDDRDFSDFRNKTIAFWVNVLVFPDDYPYMFYFTDEEEAVENPNPYRIYFLTYTPAKYWVRMRFGEEYSASYKGGNPWYHLAFVLENTPDGKCTGTFYGDGATVATMTGRPEHFGAAVGVNIGSENDGKSSFVNALFDDFRVYDYNLSGPEIWNLAHDGVGGQAPNNNLMLLHYTFNEEGPNTVAHNSSSYEYYHPLTSDAELYKGVNEEGLRSVDFRDFAILANNWLKEQLWP